MKLVQKKSTVLALETSCDESAVALVSLEDGNFNVIASEVASQIEEHARWGGVVPEIASRKHIEALPFLIDRIFAQTGMKFSDIGAVASSVTPGLTGALLAGSITARTISSLNKIPFLGIHHLEGHLASICLSDKPPSPPYLVLLVSGGHTELIRVEGESNFLRLGHSHDDAAGEAFDKVARLLGLPYPGGPEIQKAAEFGDPKKYLLPKGRVSNPSGGFYPYAFSFSGLKTAMLRQVEALKSKGEKTPVNDLAASFEQVVAEVLVERSIRCALDEKLNSLVLVGGVASNNRLRQLMCKDASKNGIKVYLAPKPYCTDNAAMIGAAALLRLESGYESSSLTLGVSARWPLEKAKELYNQVPPF